MTERLAKVMPFEEFEEVFNLADKERKMVEQSMIPPLRANLDFFRIFDNISPEEKKEIALMTISESSLGTRNSSSEEIIK